MGILGFDKASLVFCQRLRRKATLPVIEKTLTHRRKEDAVLLR